MTNRSPPMLSMFGSITANEAPPQTDEV
jgi:hypothetical protein